MVHRSADLVVERFGLLPFFSSYGRHFGEKLRGTNIFGCIRTSLYMDPHTKSDGQSISVIVRFHGGDTGACSRAETASLVHPGHDSRQGKEHFAFLSIGIFFRFSEDTSKK